MKHKGDTGRETGSENLNLTTRSGRVIGSRGLSKPSPKNKARPVDTPSKTTLPVYKKARKSSKKMDTEHLYDFQVDENEVTGKRLKKSQKVKKRAKTYVRHTQARVKKPLRERQAESVGLGVGVPTGLIRSTRANNDIKSLVPSQHLSNILHPQDMNQIPVNQEPGKDGVEETCRYKQCNTPFKQSAKENVKQQHYYSPYKQTNKENQGHNTKENAATHCCTPSKPNTNGNGQNNTPFKLNNKENVGHYTTPFKQNTRQNVISQGTTPFKLNNRENVGLHNTPFKQNTRDNVGQYTTPFKQNTRENVVSQGTTPFKPNNRENVGQYTTPFKQNSRENVGQYSTPFKQNLAEYNTPFKLARESNEQIPVIGSPGSFELSWDQHCSTPARDRSCNSTHVQLDVSNWFGFEEEPEREELLLSPIRADETHIEMEVSGVDEGVRRSPRPEQVVGLLKSECTGPTPVLFSPADSQTDDDDDPPPAEPAPPTSPAVRFHLDPVQPVKVGRRSYERPAYMRNLNKSFDKVESDEEVHSPPPSGPAATTKPKPKPKQKKKRNVPSKKEKEELDKWAQAFNSQCQQVEAFDLCIE